MTQGFLIYSWGLGTAGGSEEFLSLAESPILQRGRPPSHTKLASKNQRLREASFQV